MNACKQQEEKMLSWLISRTFKYHFSTSWTFDGSCFNTVRKGFKVKGIPGFGNTSLSSMNTCLRQNIKQCNRIVFPSEKCSNLLLNWEQTNFQVYYCWGSTFSQNLWESIPEPWCRIWDDLKPNSFLMYPSSTLACENMTVKNSRVLLVHDREWTSYWCLPRGCL